MIFTHVIHPQIDTSQHRMKDILNLFNKGLDFGLDDQWYV